jgi:hypothetical protein
MSTSGAHLVTAATSLDRADAFGTSRESRLFPDHRLVHTDLHNHSHLSDGAGDPDRFYSRIRAAGLDVAALTDHSSVVLPDPTSPAGYALQSWSAAAWARSRALADAADVDGEFTALPGFEWTSPTVGHVNVWFSRTWTDPTSTDGLADVTGLLNWLRRPAGGPDGGGSDALFGYNHPGREPGRFGGFRFARSLRDRMVSVEMFNRTEDYLFEGVADGNASPLVQVLDAGWRPGILGTSDEHEPDWGNPVGKGKAGLWVRELSRAGVHEALQARRFFATREKGLRLDAAANGQRMGTTFGHTTGTIRIQLDIAQFDQGGGGDFALADHSRGERVPPVAMAGTPLVVQVLQRGRPLPAVRAQETVVVPGPSRPPVALEVEIDVTDGDWLVVRLCDPSRPADGMPDAAELPGQERYRSAGRAVAYTSPWFLDPTLDPQRRAVR